jgi:hypothetical protein
VVLPGRVVFVELKRQKGGRFSPHQMWYADEFNQLGVAIAVVRNSADIDQRLENEKAELGPAFSIHPSTTQDKRSTTCHHTPRSAQ